MTRQFLRLTVPINAPLPGGNTEAPSPAERAAFAAGEG